MKQSIPEISILQLITRKSEESLNFPVITQIIIEFIVSYEIKIKVFATEKIGELADDLIKIGVTKIESFEWASN